LYSSPVRFELTEISDGFHKSIQANASIPQLLPSKSFPIHYSLIILLIISGAIETEVQTVSLHKTKEKKNDVAD
jgi:hypothetical protein